MHSLECRRLLPENLTPIRTLDEYKAAGGVQALEKARTMSGDDIIAELKEANLRGRGGAGFPTWIKWSGLKGDPSDKKFMVCNGSEGEPGTFKDRWLLKFNPYSVLEGMMIGAHATGAAGCQFGIKGHYDEQIGNLKRALQEFEDAGLFEPGFLQLVYGPDEYLFGEETALLEVLDGRGAMPRNVPPYVAGLGYFAGNWSPSVVNNIESYSHVPRIISKGAAWFKEVGCEDTPGTTIFAVSGDVKRPGMYETPLGITMNQLLNDICGGPKDDALPFKAVFSGVANGALTPDNFDIPIGFGTLREVGAGLGSAGFMVYDESTCMVKLARTLSNFLAKSSCGQCIPCNNGTRVVTEFLDKMIEGRGSQDDIEAIQHQLTQTTNQTRCFLPQQEVIIMTSFLKTFPAEFENYANGQVRNDGERILPKIADYDPDRGEFVYADVSKFDKAFV